MGMLHVVRVRDPFEVIRAVIKLVAIFVIYHSPCKITRNKGFGYKLMNASYCAASVYRKINSGVALYHSGFKPASCVSANPPV